MIEFLTTYLGPIMFGSLIFFLLIGFPVAFTLAAVGIIFGFIGIQLGLFQPNFLRALPERVFLIMSNETLLAIPFFTFMGLILERSRMAEDLLETVGQLLGPLRGGLALAVVLVGALMAATTGVVAAAVISMGLISLPIMLRYGYDHRLATGAIMASGTLAQIIPPSLVLIVLADTLGRSVGDFYKGALVPGLMLVGLYLLYVIMLMIVRPSHGPPIPPEARTIRGGYTSLAVMVVLSAAVGYGATLWLTPRVQQAPEIYGSAIAVLFALAVAILNDALRLSLLSETSVRVIKVLVPPLALIFLVLGTIFIGLATPTESGAMGAAGALLLAAFNGRMSFSLLRQAAEATLKLSAFVLFILIGARVFALTFYGINGHIWMKELLLALPGGVIGFLVFTNLVVFILGMFLDFFEIAFILMPLLVFPALALNIDLVWFGVIMAINMQTSFLTPPFGFALFYLRSVAPSKAYVDAVTGQLIQGIPTTTLYKAVIPFIFVQLIMVAIVAAFPGLVMHYKAAERKVAPADIQRQLDNLQIPGIGDPPVIVLPPQRP